MHKSLAKSTSVLGLLMVAGVIFAATHYLVSWGFSYQEDAASEYSATMAFFSKVQSIRPDSGNWRPGDKFTVEYSDGMVAEFPLSTRGMACVAGKCKWATTVPFDQPVIIKGKRAGLTNTLSDGGGVGGLSPYANPRTITFYPEPMPFQRGWTVIVGPLTEVAVPPSGCTVNCPMLR